MREEIRERKDKLECMLKPKQNRLRPESPGRPPIVGGPRRRLSKSGSATPMATTTPSAVNNRAEDKRGVGGGASGLERERNGAGGGTGAQSARQANHKPSHCSYKAVPIGEHEENERLLAMEKRGVLLRSLGVVEAVYRLLGGTAGVEPSKMGPKKKTNWESQMEKPKETAATNYIAAANFSGNSEFNCNPNL